MKNVKKVFLFSAILSCVVFLGRKVYDGYASMNTEGDYMLKGEPNTYYEAISLNSNSSSSDYTLKGELNIYHETFPPISKDIDSNAIDGMYSGNLVIAEPTPLPEQ